MLTDVECCAFKVRQYIFWINETMHRYHLPDKIDTVINNFQNI